MDLVLNVVFDLVDDLKGNRCAEPLPAAVSDSEVLKAQETAGKTRNEMEPNSPSDSAITCLNHTPSNPRLSLLRTSQRQVDL